MVFQQPVLGQKSYLKHGSYIYILPSQTSCTILREIPSKLPATFVASSLIKYKPTQNKMDGTPISFPPQKPPKKTFQTFQCQPGPQPPVHVPSNGVQELPATQYLATWQPMGSLDEKNRWFRLNVPQKNPEFPAIFFSPKRYYSSSRYL